MCTRDPYVRVPTLTLRLVFPRPPLPPLAGEVPPVLARRALGPVPILCGGPHGGVQHAAVHPARVQGHRRQGKSASVCVGACVCVRLHFIVCYSGASVFLLNLGHIELVNIFQGDGIIHA